MTQVDMHEAVVAVFGDLGRSPRMVNHARELLKQNFRVHIIGYRGDGIESEFAVTDALNFHFVKPWSSNWIFKNYPAFQAYLKVLVMLIRILLLSFSLIFLFFKLHFTCKKVPKLMIIQTPPVLPLLLIAPIYCLLSGAKLVVDWHNFGYTLIDDNQPFLKALYKRIEIGLGRICSIPTDWNYICVSKSMKKWILNNFHTRKNQIDVLYDRPSDKYFIRSDSDRYREREYFFNRFNIINRESLFFVSSTSWTPDEDFNILLNAILISDKQLQKHDTAIKPIIFFITGKGPLRNEFEHRIQGLDLKYFEIITVWLESDSYPRLLACADLGISLHTSSSGLDLPMKIIDMLGSGLPVCAFFYECLLEIMEKKKFGYVFKNEVELARIMTDISKGKESENIKNIRNNIKINPMSSWNHEWLNWFKNMSPSVKQANSKF